MPYKGTRGTEYSDVDVVCPCFKAANSKDKLMVCEGAAAGSKIVFCLKQKERYQLFRRRFCERDYRACPYYRAVEDRCFADERRGVPYYGKRARSEARG